MSAKPPRLGEAYSPELSLDSVGQSLSGKVHRDPRGCRSSHGAEKQSPSPHLQGPAVTGNILPWPPLTPCGRPTQSICCWPPQMCSSSHIFTRGQEGIISITIISPLSPLKTLSFREGR